MHPVHKLMRFVQQHVSDFPASWHAYVQSGQQHNHLYNTAAILSFKERCIAYITISSSMPVSTVSQFEHVLRSPTGRPPKATSLNILASSGTMGKCCVLINRSRKVGLFRFVHSTLHFFVKSRQRDLDMRRLLDGSLYTAQPYLGSEW